MLPNHWYHVVHEWSAGGGLRLYVNGVLDGSASQSIFTGSGLSNYLAIGGPQPGGTGCSTDAATGFAGTIDDVRIYNRALSPQEVQQLYLMGK